MNVQEDAKRRLLEIRACWFLTGATASGKTALGVELAKLLDAEVICLDSMTIYRGMDIGTAKPASKERERVAHHLIDIVEPDQTYSVAAYCDAAWEAVQAIRSRGKQVLFVGGTPLYLKSLLRGIFDGPPADWDIRQEIEKEVAVHGLPALRQRLELIDPLTAHKLHPNDRRRMIRALEVYRKTGQPISHLQRQFEEQIAGSEANAIVLSWPREVLHERIAARVESMFAAGLVEEVKQLLEKYQQLSRTATQAVGYREVIDHLQDEIDLDETMRRVLVRTRQFARRQETWFRGLQECRWFPMTADRNEVELAQAIHQQFAV